MTSAFVGDAPAASTEDYNTARFECGAIKCEICDMWLNGIEQWDHHRIGKKHRKHRKRLDSWKCFTMALLDENAR